MTQPTLFTDITSGTTGTVLDQVALNTLMVSGTCLLAGTTPTNPANWGSTLTMTYAQQQYVVQGNAAGVDNGGGAGFFALPSGSLTVSASKDTYIEVDASGNVIQNAVNNGAAAPVQTTNTIRLWKVVSGPSAITAVTLQARMVYKPGLVQTIVSSNTTNSPNLNATSWTTLPWTMTPSLSLTVAGGTSSVRCRLSTANLGSAGAPLSMSWQAVINGVTYPLGSVYLPTTSPIFGHSFVCETPVLPPGTYAVTLQYQNSSGVNVAAAAGAIVVELDELAA